MRQGFGRVGGDGDDEVVVHVARRLRFVLRSRRAPDFNFEQVTAFEAFNQHPIDAVIQLGNQLVNAHLVRLLELAHQGQPVA